MPTYAYKHCESRIFFSLLFDVCVCMEKLEFSENYFSISSHLVISFQHFPPNYYVEEYNKKERKAQQKHWKTFNIWAKITKNRLEQREQQRAQKKERKKKERHTKEVNWKERQREKKLWWKAPHESNGKYRQNFLYMQKRRTV